MTNWYVARTRPQSERKALFNLIRQGFRVYLPRYLKRRRHARKVEWIEAPLFPRYLFVRFDARVEPWRAISSTFGVDRLICREDSPVPVPGGIVDDIRAREDARGLVPLGLGRVFARGDRVQVLSGAFADIVGRFESVSDEERVFVLLDLLGRHVRVRVPADVLVAAG